MEPQGLTNITPAALILVLCLGTLTMVLPRRFALAPIIVGACYLTLGQVIMVGSLHFYMLRVLIIFGWARLTIREEISLGKWHAVDTAIILWIISSIVTYTVLRQTTEALINRLGLAFDAAGLYFMARCLLRDFEEVNRLLRITAFVVLPLAMAMLLEGLTGRNLFAVLGGVYEYSEVREGSVRAQGAFRHPILAGTFGATLMPALAAIWWQSRRGKLTACIGIVATTTIAITSHSSGPLMALVFGIIGLAMWRWRQKMRAVRWGVVLILASFQIIMIAPVYYLIDRMSGLIGGSGWYRSYLIEQAISHFNEWWLLGVQVTAHWMPFYFATTQKSDITNQFIAEGVNGGLITMILFIAIIVLSFKAVGRALIVLRETTFGVRITVWSLGVSLLTHVVSFFSVSYFDQVIIAWYFILAMIVAVSNDSARMESESLAEPSPLRH